MTYYGIQFGGPHLEHHGILGMKWGVRRYQNKDGSLTAAGRKRYAKKLGYLDEKDMPTMEDSKEAIVSKVKKRLPEDYADLESLKKYYADLASEAVSNLDKNTEFKTRSIIDYEAKLDVHYKMVEYGMTEDEAYREGVREAVMHPDLIVDSTTERGYDLLEFFELTQMDISDRSRAIADKITKGMNDEYADTLNVYISNQMYADAISDGTKRLEDWYYKK